MDYQVRFNFEDRQNKALDVARTEKEFNDTTILDLKTKLKQKIPGAPEPDKFIVIFGKDTLEDDMTLGYYRIQRLSLLMVVMRMPGGCVFEDMGFKNYAQAVQPVLTVKRFAVESDAPSVYSLSKSLKCTQPLITSTGMDC